jgi:H+/gluconate symporter-like permease
MQPWTRKASPFAAAVALAFVVVTASDAGLPASVVYALAGFIGGVLAVAGTLVATGVIFGPRVEKFGGVQPIKSADLAPQLISQIATTNIHVKLVVHRVDRLQKDVVVSQAPSVAPADRTLRARACPI